MSNTPLIALRGVHKVYHTLGGDTVGLAGVDLDIFAGEFVALWGRSGAGKSTLINLVTGIDRPDRGSIVIASQALERFSEDQLTRWRGRNVGVVFQSFQLMPMLTCVQNVMLPMDFAHRFATPRAQQARAMELLAAMGIAEHAHKRPAEVSGGQRQRVAIARALANDPIFIAADEPTGNLDSVTAQTVMDIFLELAAGGTTILMATHDPDLARYATRIVQIEDGRITDRGATEANSTPRRDDPAAQQTQSLDPQTERIP